MRYSRFKPIFLFPIAILVLIFVSYHLAYQDRIYPGIKIANINVGNRTKAQTESIILQKIQTHPSEMEIYVEDKKYKISWDDLGIDYKVKETIDQTFNFGRGFWRHDFKEKFIAWVLGQNMTIQISYNQEYLDKKLAEIEHDILVPAVEPQIKVFENPQVSGSRILIEPGKDGKKINIQQGKEYFNLNISNLDFNPIVFSTEESRPSLSNEQAEAIKERAEKLLDKTLELQAEENTYPLSYKELISFLMPIGFNEAKLKEYLASLAQTVNRPAQNASFQFENGKVVVFKPGKDGLAVNEEKLLQIIPASISSLENTEQKSAALAIPLTKTPPQVKTEDANNLGIKELIGKGQSFFKGSAASRIHNIVLASSRLNGIIVPKDETFSFVGSLGEVSKKTGYQEAYIIKEGRTILDDGGGVCQVSTTFFRAALNTGIPILERRAHAYRVSYYEQGTQPGIDATVFIPSPDFKFKNDTGNNLLIQTLVDTKTSSLIVEFYGTSDGRVATMSAVKVFDQTPPPPDLYQDDPTLPIGQIKQIEKPIWGAKTSFSWKVVRNGEVLQDRTFNSTYQPWQAVYLRGTKPI